MTTRKKGRCHLIKEQEPFPLLQDAELVPKSADSGGVTSSPHVAGVPEVARWTIEGANRPPKDPKWTPREVT